MGYQTNIFVLKNHKSDEKRIESSIEIQLKHLINEEQVFTNKNLKISDLASLLNTTDKALSHHIHENFGMSFTNYINQLRVEKVKTLLYSREQDKYTLLAIAEKAGFSSKSSFNAVFKKITGLTPTQYKTRYKN